MKKILIISTTTEEENAIDRVKPSDFSVTATASFGQEASWWTQNSPHLLIIRFPEDEILQGYFFTKLRRDVPRSLPIIILAETVSSALLKLGMEFQKVRVLKVPYSEEVLKKTIIDLSTAREEGKEQTHARYFTNIPVILQSSDDQFQIEGMAKNLSVGGAYIEAQLNQWDLKVGDIIKLTIQSYQFNAKVIWSQGGTEGELGFGVAFVDQNELYNELLKGN